MKDINWLREATGFFTDLYPIKKQSDLETIYQQATDLVKKYAHADAALLARQEDAITCRVIYATDTINEDFVDADAVNELIAANTIVIANGALIKGKDTDTAVMIPVSEKAFTGAFILFYADQDIITDQFNQFLNHIWTGLRETTMLIQTYYNLEQLTTRFNAILSNIPEGIVFVDDSGKQGWVNPVAAELLNIQEGSNIPVAIATAMQQLRNTAVNQNSIQKEGAKLFSSPNRTIKNWEWIFGDPISKVLHVSCAPASSQNTRGVLWVFDDVTSQYLASQQLKALNEELDAKRNLADDQNRAKSDFLANMSHEIRTPMNGVIGMADLLVSTELTDEQRDYVETIRISGESLLSIINDILDFSKIESGKMELEHIPVNISTAIEDTYDLLALKANEKGLDLLYYIDPSVPAEIVSDMVRLKQVLLNLVSNGLKFTEKGEILVSVTTKNHTGDIYELEFSVKDTGIGIPKDKFHRLFESFSQVDSSTTRRYGGTGLGLAICQRLIHLMGGSIHAESEPGVGSTFIFTIQAPVSRKAVQYRSRNKAHEGLLKDKKILILDDNKTNLRILRTQCELYGMKPTTADNYRDALDVIGKVHFDIGVIDMLMPEKDGITVSKMIKQQHPELPLVLFSSAGHFPIEEQANKRIFSAILNKPVRASYIEQTLIDILNNQHRPAEAAVPSQDAQQRQSSDLKILIAEDNEINQKMILRALDKLGYKGDLAVNGKEAIEKLIAGAYKLIFMDVMMPIMDGYEATTVIHDNYKGKERPVIIAMTANALAGDREKILDHGMDDYISKPFKIQDIKEIIDKWTSKPAEQI